MLFRSLVSGGGTNLQALLDARAEGRLQSGSIVLVLSSRGDARALGRAHAHGVRAEAVERRAFPDVASFEQRLLELLDAARIYNPDRKHALDIVHLATDLEDMKEQIYEQERTESCLVATDASLYPHTVGYEVIKQRIRQGGQAIVLLFGTGWGMPH